MTPAEERVWRAFPRGQDVDFRSPADEDPGRGADWGPSGPYGRPWRGHCC